ncbi:CHRD domain-containing protein [Paenibacillus sp. cl141a]
MIREFGRSNAYVNVHTFQNPNGGIRGQVRR